MTTTYLDPLIHQELDTDVARFFRKMLGYEDIITFFHGLTGEWILAYWVHKPSRQVYELEDLGGNFEKCTSEFVEHFKHCWKAPDFKAQKKSILSNQRDRDRKNDEKILSDGERWEWLQKRLQRPMPYMFG